VNLRPYLSRKELHGITLLMEAIEREDLMMRVGASDTADYKKLKLARANRSIALQVIQEILGS
jgi:hypothetical protein